MSAFAKLRTVVASRKFVTRTSVSAVAIIAGYASYGHQKDVALMAGQPEHLAVVLPFSVDGMLAAAAAAIAEDKAEGRRPRAWAVIGFWLGAVVSTVANIASVVVHRGWDPLAIGVSAWPPLAFLITVEILSRKGKLKTADIAPVETAIKAAVKADDAADPALPAPPVSPAPVTAAKAVGAKRRPHGPRDPEKGYAERTERWHRSGK